MLSMDALVALVGKSVDSPILQEARASGQLVATTDRYETDGGMISFHWLSNKAHGYVIQHDAQGHVATVFLYVEADEGFCSFAGDLTRGLRRESTRQQVRDLLGQFANHGDPECEHESLSDRFDVGGVWLWFTYSVDTETIRRITAQANRLTQN
jgi:hypothetical protein